MRPAIFALCVLGSCSDQPTIPATGIFVRVQATADVRARLDKLQLVTARDAGAARTSRTMTVVSASAIAVWPVDLPVKAEPDDGPDVLEFVVGAYDQAEVKIAESRVLTSFSPRRQVVLELMLRSCGASGTTQVCQADELCHGASCLTCAESGCALAPFRPGAGLPEFVLGAPIHAVDDDPIDEGDGGPRVDLDAESPMSNPDGRFVDLDTGRTQPIEAGLQDDAVTTTQSPCEKGKHRCEKNAIQRCEDGVWRLEKECQSTTCIDAACVGTCAPQQRRCGGLFQKTAEVCRPGGDWGVDTTQGESGTCELSCSQGACTSICATEGSSTCSALHSGIPLSCRSGTWTPSAACPQRCEDGSGCVRAPSCKANPLCGAAESCCVARDVPGGSFSRSSDDPSILPDALIAPFALDRFEVTVSRMRAFLDQYDAWRKSGEPKMGAGAHPSASDPGWDKAWENAGPYNLPPTRADIALLALDSCDMSWSYSDVAAGKEPFPINCISWYAAFAFCVWDGGRLPTEAEWTFAAKGGAQQRPYPWTEPQMAAVASSTHAVFGVVEVVPVGSRTPLGDGRWGHADLAGNAWEWVRDGYADPFNQTFCQDCVELGQYELQVAKGGGARSDADGIKTTYRNYLPPLSVERTGGFRCAYGR